jgi:hypothetical protein
VKRAGGAVAKVKEIKVTEVAVENNPHNSRALDLRSKWSATGTVGHWGHIHTRMNEYEAIVTVEPADGAWKRRELSHTQQQQIRNPKHETRISNNN